MMVAAGDYTTGSKTDYKQSATTKKQRATAKSRVWSRQYSVSSRVTEAAFSYAAEVEEDEMEVLGAPQPAIE